MKKALSLLLLMAACLFAATTPLQAAYGYLKIHMLSVGDGRGDCFIIELPDNTKMVVDIPTGYASALINKLNDLGFSGGIKYLVGTHEHSDHIGGINEFLNNGFPVNNTKIYYPKGAINADGPNENAMVTAASARGLTVSRHEAGDYIVNTTYDGKPLKVRVISPETYKINGGADDWGSENEASMVLKITYGSKSILMQADGYGSTELSTLAGAFAGEINACQVLKVGHHGVPANGALSCREAYLDAAGVNKALITDGDLAIDATIKQRLQDRNIRYWSSGDGDGYCWLRTDGASNWEESEDPLWPPTPTVVAPSITTQPSSQTVNPGATVTFSVAASGTGPLGYQWRFNGANIAGATAASFTKSNVQSGDAGNYSVVVDNSAGSATSANAVLSVNVAPSITAQPSSQTVNAGSSVTFSVSASGTAPLSYQWRFNGADIVGANAASFTKSNVQTSDAGSYSVIVANVAGSATSANAALSVNISPTITGQPSSQTVNPGASVTFSVAATGTGPLNYQWTFNGGNIAGATAASFTKSNVQSSDAGSYAAVVSNVAGSATSGNAVLSVNVPPSITTQPVSQAVNVGSSVTFTVAASGTAPLSYQWTFNGANISGATAASFTKSGLQAADAGNYAAVVSNVAGSATSANAVLSFNTPPSITTQPASQTVNAGANVTFTVVAAGTAPLSYQWFKNGVGISGATSSSLTKTSVQGTDGGNYSVVVTNVAGSVTSANALLTVSSATPPSITTQPVSQNVVQGSSATFSVGATGTGPLSYQWRFNGANISGATASSYTRSNAQPTHQGNYSVVVANAAGSVTSVNASLTVRVSVTVDNSNAGFSVATTWSTGTSATDKFGADYRFRNTQAVSDQATWSANLANSGSYTVSAWWSQGVNRSTTAPYVVTHSTGSTTVNKNQQINGGTWQSLGVYTLNAGTNTVKLSCWTTTGFVVMADAVKWSQ